MDLSKLPASLQYDIESSPEPRQYQTDIDSSLPVTADDPIIGNLKEIPTEDEAYEALDQSLPDISKPDLIPDDIFDKIQKKLVREKKKKGPQMRKVAPKKAVSPPPPAPAPSPPAIEEDDEEISQIKKAYVSFQEAPRKPNKRNTPLIQPETYPAGTKLTKKGRPRKELSEEAKENRRRALEKGRETRRRNMLAKKEASGESIQPVKKKIERPSSPINIPQSKAKVWTQEDLAESQYQAIEKYESLRKERKQKKKEQKAIEEQRQQIKNVVRREANWQQVSGRFANCY